MRRNSNEEGIIPIVVLIFAVGLITVAVAGNIPITMHPNSAPAVKGVETEGDSAPAMPIHSLQQEDPHNAPMQPQATGSGNRDSHIRPIPIGIMPQPPFHSPEATESGIPESRKGIDLSVGGGSAGIDQAVNQDLQEALDQGQFRSIEISIKGNGLAIASQSGMPMPASISGQIAKNPLRLIRIKVKQLQGEGEVAVGNDNNQLSLSANGVTANTTFPISVNGQTNQLEVTTPAGMQPVNVMPDQAAQIAKSAGVQTTIAQLQLVANESGSSTDSTVFMATGTKSGKLFNFIPVSASVTSQIGAQTGTVLSVQEPLWLRILNPLVH